MPCKLERYYPLPHLRRPHEPVKALKTCIPVRPRKRGLKFSLQAPSYFGNYYHSSVDLKKQYTFSKPVLFLWILRIYSKILQSSTYNRPPFQYQYKLCPKGKVNGTFHTHFQGSRILIEYKKNCKFYLI